MDRLAPGDSLYFDSAMGHVYLSEHVSVGDAIICGIDRNVPHPVL